MNLNLTKIAEELTFWQKEVADIHKHPDKYGITRDIISKGKIKGSTKNDYTSRVDQVIEAKLKPVLLKLIYNSGFLGEETSSSGMNQRYRWIMDPTDGTAIYSLGGEYYSNSIALIDREANNGKGAVILGSVYQSAKDKQFLMVGSDLIVREPILTKEGLAKIERIPVPSESKGFLEYLGCSYEPSFYHEKYPEIKEKLEKVFEKQTIPLLDRPYSLIDARPGSGSSALFNCEIADGKRHFALLFYQKAWDMAVGAVYAQKAGCPVVLFDYRGNIINQNLEASIAQCDKNTLLHIGVFANEHAKEYVLNKFNMGR